MTFYLKYRPQKIEDLDLDVVRESLKGSIREGKFAQAYLFVGPRGAGKTSAARILAKCINCIDLKEGEPCLVCESCRLIENGSAVDVMEVDAASHRGIDAIRELKDKIALAPVNAKKKVYIIDEVHMLTTEAFNALLKTLEEPPEHVTFILCTTEEHKIPETIMSRCVKVGFVKGSKEEVLRSLNKVIVGEKVKVKEGALEELAGFVDGSFREGHKLLEQLVMDGEEVTVEKVRNLLGLTKGVEEKKLAVALLNGEVREALNELKEVEKKGISWPVYAEKVLEYLRGQMKAKYGLGESEVENSVERIKLVTSKVAGACIEMKQAVLPGLCLEMIAVELGKEGSETKVKIQVEDGPLEAKKVRVEVEQRSEEKEGNEEKKDEEVETDISGISMDVVLNKWGNMIRFLEPQNHSVAGLLRSCRPKKIENRFLVIEAFYKFHKEQLEQDARRRMVEAALKQEVGLPAVKFVLGDKAATVTVKMPDHDNVAAAPSGDDKLIEAVGDVFGVDV